MNFRDFINTQTAQSLTIDSLPTATVLTQRPSILTFFTTDAPMVKLHYHPEVKYFVCPGEGCPACEVDKPPRDTYLFPVINLPRKRVEVLRVPHLMNPDGTLIPDSLLMGIAALMADPTNTNRVAKVSKTGGFRYAVEPVPGTIPAETKALIEDLDSKFKSDLATDTIGLEGFYPHLTVEEIREIPSIHEDLKLCGLLTEDNQDDALDGADAV